MYLIQVSIGSGLQIPCKHSTEWACDKEECNAAANFPRLIPRPDYVDGSCEGAALKKACEESHGVKRLNISSPSKAEGRQSPSDLKGW